MKTAPGSRVAITNAAPADNLSGSSRYHLCFGPDVVAACQSVWSAHRRTHFLRAPARALPEVGIVVVKVQTPGGFQPQL
jgi:hypothetical protein